MWEKTTLHTVIPEKIVSVYEGEGGFKIFQFIKFLIQNIHFSSPLIYNN